MSCDNETLDDYFAKLNIEGKRTVWVENRVKIDYVYRKIKKYLRNASTACEVGVGEGYLLRLLYGSRLRVHSIDVSKYLVNELRKRFAEEGLNIELIHGDISKVKLQKDKFDVVFCLDVLEHIPDVMRAMQNIKEGLRDRGLLIGTLPFHENLNDNMVICPKCKYKFHRIGHWHSFNSVEELKRLLGPEFDILETGEVNPFRKKFDSINYFIQKITKLLSRKRIPATVYFVARIDKNNLVNKSWT